MRISSAALIAVLAAACTEDASPPSAPPTSRPAERAATDRGEPAPPEPAPEPRATEAPARALVERWRAAQNEGDLAAYEALYATRFEGVKRSGDRVRYLDRAGWLRDRARMFRRPMEVSVGALEVRATSAGAVVDFEQRWSSPTYEDVGPKRLVLTEEGGTLRIAREEMLRSTIDAGDATVPGLPLGRFFFTVEAEGLYVVVHPSVERGWARGPRALRSQEGHFAVTREADPEALPDELAALAGREVRLYDASKEVCRAALGPLTVMKRVTPHFGQVQHWKGELGEPPSNDATIAAEVETMAGASGVLVAPVGAECAGALYAQRADAPAAAPVALEAASGATAAAALGAVRGTAQYRAAAPGRQLWDEHPEARVAISVGELGGEQVGVVELSAGANCGGDLNVRMITPIAQRAGRWVALDGPGDRLRVLAMVDLEGAPALLVERDLGQWRGLLRPAGDHYIVGSAVEYPYFDCGC
jgi:hypothetical protein